MTATAAARAGAGPRSPVPPRFVYRHRLVMCLWHWVNALTVFVMLMSDMMIFKAYPALYQGQYGANDDSSWSEIGDQDQHGFLRISSVTISTTGVLGYAQGQELSFPPLVTIPTSYDLAAGRAWHFFFAWLLVAPTLLYWVWCVATRHLLRGLAPLRVERQLGYKQANCVMAVEAVASLDGIGFGKASYRKDSAGYQWFGGI